MKITIKGFFKAVELLKRNLFKYNKDMLESKFYEKFKENDHG